MGYMEMLQEEDPTRYEAQFAKFIENDMEADGLEDLYKEAVVKIREDPDFEKAAKKEVTCTRDGDKITDTEGGNYVRSLRLTLEQRRRRWQPRLLQRRRGRCQTIEGAVQCGADIDRRPVLCAKSSK